MARREVLAGWRVAGEAMYQRVAAVRMMFSMWLTDLEDVQLKWAGCRGCQKKRRRSFPSVRYVIM